MNIFIASYLSETEQVVASSNAKADLLRAKSDIHAFHANGDSGISVKDRSMNYGDGCFTTIYAQENSVYLLPAHLQRLLRDCHKLGIEICTETIYQWLILGLNTMVTKSRNAFAIKILVSRGIGGRGYELPQSPNTQIVVTLFPVASLSLNDLNNEEYRFVVRQANMRLSSQALLAGIKHLNRLEQILAKRELQNSMVEDLLLCDQTGKLIEATASNIFYRKDGIWYTPDMGNSGVNGVMRDAILSFMQKEGLQHHIKIALFNDLFDAEAIFLCNAIRFIIPVSAIATGHKQYQYDVSSPRELLVNLYDYLSVHHVEKLKDLK